MANFLEHLSEHTAARPEQTALEFLDEPRQRVTYGELGELLGHCVGYLRSLGVEPGDRVALQLPKCLEFILLHLATLRLGAISLPLNPAYPPDETEYFLSDSGARLFFTAAQGGEGGGDTTERPQRIELDSQRPQRFLGRIAQAEPALPELPPPAAGDTAALIYTSGTTGRPKGAEITHGNLAANLESLHAAWGWRSDDVLLHVLPIFHVHGLFVALLGALHAGASVRLVRAFEARPALETLAGKDCTVFMAVPTIHRRLLAVPDARRFDLSRLRLITSGSDRLPDEVFTAFQQTFGYTLLERYGMSETGMIASNPLHGERRMGSVGLPLPGVEVRVVEPESGLQAESGQVGEVQVRGASVFRGYWRQPEKTAAAFTPDGWFHTGDLGLLEPDGYLTLSGRAKDLIISGGLNVYPPEVERVLAGHPAVAASAVIGCPDAEWGERVTAVVVLNEGQQATPEELIAFCRARLAAYKAPKAVVFREGLPRNAMGKVQKGEVRKQVC